LYRDECHGRRDDEYDFHNNSKYTAACIDADWISVVHPEQAISDYETILNKHNQLVVSNALVIAEWGKVLSNSHDLQRLETMHDYICR
jgi:hypothetical protein